MPAFAFRWEAGVPVETRDTLEMDDKHASPSAPRHACFQRNIAYTRSTAVGLATTPSAKPAAPVANAPATSNPTSNSSASLSSKPSYEPSPATSSAASPRRHAAKRRPGATPAAGRPRTNTPRHPHRGHDQPPPVRATRPALARCRLVGPTHPRSPRARTPAR